MPRLSNEQINARVRAAMTALIQPAQQGLAPNTMDSLMQKAKQKRGAMPEVKPKARGM